MKLMRKWGAMERLVPRRELKDFLKVLSTGEGIFLKPVYCEVLSKWSVMIMLLGNLILSLGILGIGPICNPGGMFTDFWFEPSVP
jgi:hypothetical protein